MNLSVANGHWYPNLKRDYILLLETHKGQSSSLSLTKQWVMETLICDKEKG